MINEGIVTNLNQTGKFQKSSRKNLYVLSHPAQLCAPHEIPACN
jgi:hypothetical protein